MTALDGKWKVSADFIDGDVKFIKGLVGYNRWHGLKWGKFDIVEYEYGYSFHYRNRLIVDTVRFDGVNKLKGKFFKCGKFVGPFTMERI